MADDFEDRTEQPTERRRSEAREQGNVARSVDLNAAVLLLAAAATLALFATPLVRAMGELMHGLIVGVRIAPLTTASAVEMWWELARAAGAAALPPMLLMAAAALAVNMVQVGFLFAPDVLQPKMSRLSPLAGLQRIASRAALVRLGVSLGKLLIAAALAAWCIAAVLPHVVALAYAEWQTVADVDADGPFRERRTPPLILQGIQEPTVRLAFQMAGGLVVLALLDFGFQRWRHEQELRMTKQELRDEMKNMEGDPHIRQRRREVHRKLAEARQLQDVKRADVVITNPTHISVALRYDAQTMAAPTVVAKGKGEIALRIREIAAAHGIPIIERKPLARALYEQVKVGRTIPLEMYEVFVEIMAYVYRLSGRRLPG